MGRRGRRGIGHFFGHLRIISWEWVDIGDERGWAYVEGPGVGVGTVVLGSREGSGKDGQEEAQSQHGDAETGHFGLLFGLV